MSNDYFIRLMGIKIISKKKVDVELILYKNKYFLSRSKHKRIWSVVFDRRSLRVATFTSEDLHVKL